MATIGKVKEWRVVGPPGTGKTTWLCRQAELALIAIQERSVDSFDAPGGILFSSLTRAAANELRRRGLSVGPEAIGTLHAHAWRACGRPPLAVDAKAKRAWNDACSDPRYRLSVQGTDRTAPDRAGESRGAEETGGDSYLARYHVARARLLDRGLWSMELARFADEYESWKRVSGLVDFSDVIHDAVDLPPPGNPSVIFVDEAQDHDRAELRLVRRWAEADSVEQLVVVGDPDQNLYQWRGAEPEAFYEGELPPEQTRVLAQSYRVPRAVHQVAMEMIGRVDGRRPVEYHPTDEPGDVRFLAAGFGARGIEELADDIEAALPSGKSIMALAACEYQLRPLCNELRARGVPYWNPLAKERGGMNPLHPANGRSAIERVLAYLRPSEEVHGDQARLWTAADLWAWVEVCEAAGWLSRGAKKEIERAAGAEDQPPVSAEQLLAWCSGSIPADLKALDPHFLRARLLDARRGAMTFALDVLRRHGAEGLLQPPRIVVGTIHSVKGGEADIVYLCPDLSPQGFDLLDSADAAPIYRQFYVGMTRARERLVLCDPIGSRSIEW